MEAFTYPFNPATLPSLAVPLDRGLAWIIVVAFEALSSIAILAVGLLARHRTFGSHSGPPRGGGRAARWPPPYPAFA